MSTITVKNTSGQVSSFSLDGPDGLARKQILEQRIARGELTRVPKGTKSVRPGEFAVVDSDTGLTDEAGNLLKSVHGGGIDPDAEGDVLGLPTGSQPVEGAVEVPADTVSAAAVAQASAQPQSEAAAKAAEAKAAANATDDSTDTSSTAPAKKTAANATDDSTDTSSTAPAKKTAAKKPTATS
jgi:hypothetical protein